VGSNTIILRVEDAKGNAAETRLEVTRRAGPAVRVISPAEGDTAWGHAIALRAVVSGITYHDAVQVRVNGTPQPVQNPLLFSDSVAAGEAVDLKPGANTLVVQVTDAEGHTAEQTIHVVAVVPSVSYAVTVLSAAGAVSSLAADINNAGTVVGRWFGADGESHAIAWQGAAGTTLGSLVSAAAINQKGQVVASGADGTYVWENGAAAKIPAGTVTDPVDINEAGEILFWYGFVWRRDGQLVPVSNQASPYSPQRVHALNSGGDVVGYDWGTYTHGRRWDAAGVPHDVLGGRTSDAAAINDAGQIIGWATQTGDASTRAYFVNGANVTDLSKVVGFLPVATGLSPNGTVAGLFSFEGRPTVYLFRNGKTTDVAIPGTAWSVGSVIAVNDAGQIAVNAHQGSGPITALLLTPIP
jgi:probable HAF family extracellular repeat protein